VLCVWLCVPDTQIMLVNMVDSIVMKCNANKIVIAFEYRFHKEGLCQKSTRMQI
jgi:hypothetical protein